MPISITGSGGNPSRGEATRGEAPKAAPTSIADAAEGAVMPGSLEESPPAQFETSGGEEVRVFKWRRRTGSR